MMQKLKSMHSERLYMAVKKLFGKNIKPLPYGLIIAGLVLLRLTIAACQRVFLLTDGSGLDDMLMVRAAQNVVQGNWFGAYGGVAIAKNMGFALWLALLNKLHMPLLMANAALWLAACLFAVYCMRPVLKGNIVRLIVFAFFAFQPVSWAGFTLRAYRDAVFPALSMLVFAGAAGFALRLSQNVAKGYLACALGCGLGLAGVWLTREDGAVVLVFAVCAFLCCLVKIAADKIFAIKNNKKIIKKEKLEAITNNKKTSKVFVVKTILCILPFIMLISGILGFSAANKKYYGVFMVSDMSQGAFAKAYGAVSAVSRAQSAIVPMVPVSNEAIESLIENVPSFALLQNQLNKSSSVRSGFAHKEGELAGSFNGSFYYALRLAADYEGLTPNAQTAQSYWRQMQNEIEQAVQEGRLQSEKPSASLIPKWNSDLFIPLLKEFSGSFMYLMLFEDCSPYSAESVGNERDVAEVSAFLHSKVQSGYEEGSDLPYHNPLQKIMFTFCNIVTIIYRILIWPLFAAALFALGFLARQGVRKNKITQAGSGSLLNAVVALGLLLSFVLRLGVAAYMEVAAFGIGRYMMYLSGAAPALLLFIAFTGFTALWQKQHLTVRNEVNE